MEGLAARRVANASAPNASYPGRQKAEGLYQGTPVVVDGAAGTLIHPRKTHGKRAGPAFRDRHIPGLAADLTVLDHVAGGLGIDDQLLPFAAIRALDLDQIFGQAFVPAHTEAFFAQLVSWYRSAKACAVSASAAASPLFL